MERIGVIGVSSRRSGVATLPAFTIPKEQQAERLPALAAALGVAEVVYLATCNRVEVAFRGDGRTAMESYRRRAFAFLTGRPPAPREAERLLRAWGGEGAVEHLFLVAAGLDSAQLGEREVRTQLRDALKLAREIELSGSMLDHVVTEALRVAAEVHQRVGAGDGHSSLGDVAADRIVERLRRTGGRAALLGVSPMTRRCARRLAQAGMPPLVVNRTLERAEELAAAFDGEARSLDDFRRRPAAVEALLTATGCPGAVLDRPALERLAARTPSGEPPLVVDMAVPPDVDPDEARAAGVERLGMDEIAREAEACRCRLLVEMAPARELVDQGLEELRRRLAERLMSPVIARLNQRYRETARQGVERLFSKELKGLDDAERDAVCRWAEVLAKRFAHIPTMGLRHLASQAGADAVRSFLEGSGEQQLAELAMVADDLASLEAAEEGVMG